LLGVTPKGGVITLNFNEEAQHYGRLTKSNAHSVALPR